MQPITACTPPTIDGRTRLAGSLTGIGGASPLELVLKREYRRPPDARGETERVHPWRDREVKARRTASLVVLERPHRWQLSWSPSTGETALQLRASRCWRMGPHVLAETLDDIEAGSCWRITDLELAIDYNGQGPCVDDLAAFTGKLKPTLRGGPGGQRVEGIDVGSRQSPMSLCWYDKTEEARGDARKLASYRRTWQRAGVDQTKTIWRVELRFLRRSLDDLRLRGPRLTERDVRQAAAAGLERIRLVRPGPARKRDRQTDPRWSELLRLSSSSTPREASRRRPPTWEASVDHAEATIVRQLHRLAALHGLVDPTPQELAALALEAAQARPMPPDQYQTLLAELPDPPGHRRARSSEN